MSKLTLFLLAVLLCLVSATPTTTAPSASLETQKAALQIKMMEQSVLRDRILKDSRVAEVGIWLMATMAFFTGCGIGLITSSYCLTFSLSNLNCLAQPKYPFQKTALSKI